MEKEEFFVPNAEEMLKIMQEIMKSGSVLDGDEENPGKFLTGIDSVMNKVEQLMQKCDEIEDDSEEIDFDEFFEELPEDSK